MGPYLLACKVGNDFELNEISDLLRAVDKQLSMPCTLQMPRTASILDKTSAGTELMHCITDQHLMATNAEQRDKQQTWGTACMHNMHVCADLQLHAASGQSHSERERSQQSSKRCQHALVKWHAS